MKHYLKKFETEKNGAKNYENDIDRLLEFFERGDKPTKVVRGGGKQKQSLRSFVDCFNLLPDYAKGMLFKSITTEKREADYHDEASGAGSKQEPTQPVAKPAVKAEEKTKHKTFR